MNAVFEWLKTDAMAIIISSIISILISSYYYNKANRNDVMMSIIHPLIEELKKDYCMINYKEIVQITSGYSKRYLKKKERRVLWELVDSCTNLCADNIFLVHTKCLMNYYIYKLQESGIDEDLEEIWWDRGFYQLEKKILSLLNSCLNDECLKSDIISIFNEHMHTFFPQKEEIVYFEDYSLDFVLDKSQEAKKWKEKINRYEKIKEKFYKLNICKKTRKELE